MTTAAAIDRLVHHSIILELNLPSYRFEKAKQKNCRQSEILVDVHHSFRETVTRTYHTDTNINYF